MRLEEVEKSNVELRNEIKTKIDLIANVTNEKNQFQVQLNNEKERVDIIKKEMIKLQDQNQIIIEETVQVMIGHLFLVKSPRAPLVVLK